MIVGYLPLEAIAAMSLPHRANGGVATTFLATFMLRYLRIASDTSQRNRVDNRMDEMQSQILAMRHNASGLTDDDRGTLIREIRVEAASQISTEFERQLRETYAPAVDVLRKAAEIQSAAANILERLKSEVRALMRRGNLNLVLGTVTTSVAAMMLAFIAFTAHLSVDDWHRYVPLYLVRPSVAVFIEVFACFFLRLYRASYKGLSHSHADLID